MIDYLRRKYRVNYVDNITEAAPVRVLAECKNKARLESIRSRLMISTEKHGSKHLGVVAHHDCAGNPVDKETQMEQLRKSIKTLRSRGFKGTIAVYGLMKTVKSQK